MYEPATSNASAYWDNSLNFARVLEKPDYSEGVADEGNVMVTADGSSATATEAVTTEVLPTERRSVHEATSGSDEEDAYVQPKKIPKPTRVKSKPTTKKKVSRECMLQLLFACLMQHFHFFSPRPSATKSPP